MLQELQMRLVPENNHLTMMNTLEELNTNVNFRRTINEADGNT